MKILDDLLLAVGYETMVRDVRQGVFQTAVLTRNCGLASTPPGYSYSGFSVEGAGLLINKGALALARMAYSPSLLEAAIGMATLNSLIEIEDRRCVSLNASALLAEKGRGRKVAMVGYFPFVPELRQEVKELWVIERHPGEEDFPKDEAKNLIPQADVVAITGSAFTNHTIEYLLDFCRPKTYVVVLGPTTPLSPVLFDYGVDAISGTTVVDTEAVLRCVSQGATFRQVGGVRLLTMKR